MSGLRGINRRKMGRCVGHAGEGASWGGQAQAKHAPACRLAYSQRRGADLSGDTLDDMMQEHMAGTAAPAAAGSTFFPPPPPWPLPPTPPRAHLLVAPMMNTVFLAFMPSISVSSWLSTRSAAPPASPLLEPRCTAIESSSSKKSTQGADWRACGGAGGGWGNAEATHFAAQSVHSRQAGEPARGSCQQGLGPRRACSGPATAAGMVRTGQLHCRRGQARHLGPRAAHSPCRRSRARWPPTLQTTWSGAPAP